MVFYPTYQRGQCYQRLWIIGEVYLPIQTDFTTDRVQAVRNEDSQICKLTRNPFKALDL